MQCRIPWLSQIWCLFTQKCTILFLCNHRCLFSHTGCYATVIYRTDLLWHTCKSEFSSLTVPTYSWEQYVAVLLSICCIWLCSYIMQIRRDVGGLGEDVADYVFHTPFIFPHRVTFTLQRGHKDSYHCVLS